ncbi:MAG: hypothetical protein R3B95_15605 [Nitrospirales bacterium]|nr:hypothetical protein [Nitrospirales bacterium]
MKKFIYVVFAFGLTILMGCSGEKSEEKEQVPGETKPHIEAKKLAETTIATETKVVCDKFELVTKISGSTLDLR